MADTESVSALIKFGLDKSTAQAAVKDLQAIREGIANTKKESEQAVRALRQVAESAEKLRNVGSTLAIAGAGLLAPFIVASQQYVQKYQQMEKVSRDYLAVQQEQANATARIGRVATDALTPIMKQVAEFQGRVASFLEQHPEVARAAMGAGTALVAGGGALVAAGTAIASLAKGMEVLKGIGGTDAGAGIAKFGVTLGALAAGTEIAVKGLNLVGEASGNQYLATYQLSDAFKTGRELIAVAIMEIAKGLLGLKKGLEESVDLWATGFRDLFSRISEALANFKNSLIDAAAGLMKAAGLDTSGILSAKDYTVGGKFGNATLENMYETGRAQNWSGYASRAAGREADYQAGLAGLAPMAGSLANWAQTGQFQGPVGGVLAQVQGLFGGVGGTGSGVGGATTQADNSELVKAYIDRQQKIKDSEKQYNSDLKKLADDRREALLKADAELTDAVKKATADRTAAEAKAEGDRQAALHDAEVERQKAEATATQRYYVTNQEALAAYYKESSQLAERARNDALSSQENFDAQMFELAADRDVAGALRAIRARQLEEQQSQRAALTDAKERDRAFRDAQDQRDAAYQDELKQARAAERDKRDTIQTAYDRQINDAKVAYTNQVNEAQLAHDKQFVEAQSAYSKQLTALQAKHAAEQTEIDRAFAVQLASMAGNYGGLNAMQAAYYAEMNSAALNFVNTQKGYLQGLYSGYTGGAATPPPAYQAAGMTISSATRASTLNAYNAGVSTNIQNIARTVHGSFASGIDYVPYDNLPSLLHRGERVLTAEQNKGYGQSIVVNVTNPVIPDYATQSDLKAYGTAVGKAVANSMQHGAYNR